MVGKGPDPMGNAAEHLAINSQAFITALLPGAHSITALTRIVSGRTCTNLRRCPLLLPSVLLSRCTRGPEHGAPGEPRLMGSSISGLKPLMGKKEPALFIRLSFCQQAWTFLSLLPTLISSRKLKIVMGNSSNAFTGLPGAPCESWLLVRD